MRIEAVTEDNLIAAAHVHAQSWRASHRDICTEAFVAAHTTERQAEYIRSGMQAGKRFFLLTDAAPVGVVAVSRNTISDLYVLPDSWGHGYGSALLAYAAGQCEGRPRLTVLNTNHRARALYQRRGFVETKKNIPLKNGLYEIELVMQKEDAHARPDDSERAD